jgi:predicted phosphodiesterase
MKKQILITLLLTILISSCFDVDYKGFLYSPIDVDERFSQSYQWNENHDLQHLKVESENYKFIVAGDSHVGGTENLKIMLSEVNKPDYSFFVICGDVTTGHTEDYIILKNTLDSLNQKPFFLVTGNHDLYYKGWESFYELFGSSSYIVEIETNNSTDLFIFLDTGSATLGKAQIEWLESILKNTRENYKKCLVFGHVNFFRTFKHKTGATNFLVEEINYLMNLFYDYDVEIVFSGHDHDRYEIDFAKTKYITLDALTDTHKTPSYLIVENNDGEITYNFVEL